MAPHLDLPYDPAMLHDDHDGAPNQIKHFFVLATAGQKPELGIERFHTSEYHEYLLSSTT